MAKFASLVLDTGGKVRSYMTNNIKYTDAPDDIEAALDEVVVVANMLPSPAQLVRKSAKEKITIAIDKDSLELFKKYAKRHDAKYQSMINDVVGAYADKFLRR